MRALGCVVEAGVFGKELTKSRRAILVCRTGENLTGVWSFPEWAAWYLLRNLSLHKFSARALVVFCSVIFGTFSRITVSDWAFVRNRELRRGKELLVGWAGIVERLEV